MPGNYDEVYSRSISDPAAFWSQAAEEIHWYKRWQKVLDDSNPPFYRWFAGGELKIPARTASNDAPAGMVAPDG